MKLAKIVDHKIVGIVEADIADDRLDKEGNLIYRPVQEDQTPIPDDHARVGDEYIIQDNQVVKKPKLQKLNERQLKDKKLDAFYTDPELPSIEDRLAALEDDDKDRIAANKAKIAALKEKHSIE